MQVNDTSHQRGVWSLAVTGVMGVLAWTELDQLLRIGLMVIGVISGVYSMLYWRHRWLREKRRE